MKALPVPLVGACGVLLASCISVKTEHEVKPIEINVNVRVQIEKELDNFFDDLDSKAASL